MINVIKPNAAEVRALTGVEVNNPVTAREAAKKLLAAGVGCVAVTAGSEGTLVVWNDDESWLPRLPVKSVDATGAGDAFAAGFAFALAEGKSFADAGIFANAAAALATTVVGAQAAMPTRDAIVELLRRIKG
jgi:ribokinase